MMAIRWGRAEKQRRRALISVNETRAAIPIVCICRDPLELMSSWFE